MSGLNGEESTRQGERGSVSRDLSMSTFEIYASIVVQSKRTGRRRTAETQFIISNELSSRARVKKLEVRIGSAKKTKEEGK